MTDMSVSTITGVPAYLNALVRVNASSPGAVGAAQNAAQPPPPAAQTSAPTGAGVTPPLASSIQALLSSILIAQLDAIGADNDGDGDGSLPGLFTDATGATNTTPLLITSAADARLAGALFKASGSSQNFSTNTEIRTAIANFLSRAFELP